MSTLKRLKKAFEPLRLKGAPKEVERTPPIYATTDPQTPAKKISHPVTVAEPFFGRRGFLFWGKPKSLD